jgi:hypothetical protein
MDEVKNDHRKPRKRQHPEKITVRRMKAALNESTHQSDINIGEPQRRRKIWGPTQQPMMTAFTLAPPKPSEDMASCHVR